MIGNRFRQEINRSTKEQEEHRLSVFIEQEDKNRKVENVKRKIKHRRIREKFLGMYGGECACCGEETREFLTLEHKKGRPKGENGLKSYILATNQFQPSLYEILCFNCNLSKGIYGYCPHSRIP